MSYRLLLVDDDELLLLALKFHFEKKGYQIETASTGKEAMQAFKDSKSKYDLIVLDSQLPDGNGAHTASEMLDSDPNLSILMFTGKPNPGITDNRVGFLQKGVGSEELYKAVELWCAKRSRTEKTP